MKEKAEQRFWNLTKVGFMAVSILLAIVAGTAINVYLDVTYEPEIEVKVDTQQIDNMTAELRSMTNEMRNMTARLENASKTWHLSYVWDKWGDMMGPFHLHGEKAMVSWMPTESTIQPGQKAEFYNATSQTALGVFAVVGNATEIDLLNGGLLSEGWYYLHYGLVGTNKTVEVYLYY